MGNKEMIEFKRQPQQTVMVNTMSNMINKTALTPMQAAFCHEYIKDLNGTRSVIAAGYSPKGASVQGSRLLKLESIQQRIAELIQARNERLEVDGDYVLQRLIAVDQMDVIDIINDDGTVKPIKEWPKVWRQYVTSFDITERISVGKEGAEAAVGQAQITLNKLKWPDKLKTLEIIGKHVSMFADQVDSAAEKKQTVEMDRDITPADAYKQMIGDQEE